MLSRDIDHLRGYVTQFCALCEETEKRVSQLITSQKLQINTLSFVVKGERNGEMYAERASPILIYLTCQSRSSLSVRSSGNCTGHRSAPVGSGGVSRKQTFNVQRGKGSQKCLKGVINLRGNRYPTKVRIVMVSKEANWPVCSEKVNEINCLGSTTRDLPGRS